MKIQHINTIDKPALIGRKLTEYVSYQDHCWFLHISYIRSSRICTIHVINIANDWVRGRQRGQISPFWEIIWHRWGASLLSLCVINANVDFFHISCITALRICTIYVINVNDRSDRGRQTGQISSSQQIILHRLGASLLSMCAFNAIVDFFTSPALAARESAPFMSSTLLMTEWEAVKEGKLYFFQR